jgi:V/A-type H+-transporting ATPase subunit D
MIIKIPATKTNFLKTKQTLALTEEGYQLLDEKRKILILELQSIQKEAIDLEEKVYISFHQAYKSLIKSIAIMGTTKMEEISLAMNINVNLSVLNKKRMGVVVSVIGVDFKEFSPFYSSSEVNVIVDETIAKFKELLNLIIKLTELKTALIRIAKEIQKTIRKVNALEKIHIPNYKETLKFIGERLDEESRESFTMLKIIKEKLERV